MTTPQEKEITNMDELDQDDIFNEETGLSSQNANANKTEIKISPEEMEKYDRLIQVSLFPL